MVLELVYKGNIVHNNETRYNTKNRGGTMGTGKKLLLALVAVTLVGICIVALVLFLPPRAPDGIRSELVHICGSDHLRIEWDSVNRADEYIVYQADRSQGPYAELSRTKDTFVESLEYTTGNTAWYKVSAIKRDREGKGSEPVHFTFPKEVRLNYRYVGNARNGKREGDGTYTYVNGDTYTGTFTDDEMTGMGMIESIEGITYVGWCEDGVPHGDGIIEWDSGDIYIGEFNLGKRHGEGTLTWDNGDMYLGQWKLDAMTGEGAYFWADGTWYEGGFLDGELYGQGTYYSDDGVLTGYWENDELIEVYD